MPRSWKPGHSLCLEIPSWTAATMTSWPPLLVADAPPYGIDFPSHRPTGRFSNGFNMADLISLAIGSEPTLPYLNPALKGERLLIGANFASAGVGVLNDTGFQFVNIIHIYKQLKLFHDYQWRVSKLIGKEEN
ncbi:unnamed protein product [Rhodiola kirilowii]